VDLDPRYLPEALHGCCGTTDAPAELMLTVPALAPDPSTRRGSWKSQERLAQAKVFFRRGDCELAEDGRQADLLPEYAEALTRGAKTPEAREDPGYRPAVSIHTIWISGWPWPERFQRLKQTAEAFRCIDMPWSWPTRPRREVRSPTPRRPSRRARRFTKTRDEKVFRRDPGLASPRPRRPGMP